MISIVVLSTMNGYRERRLIICFAFIYMVFLLVVIYNSKPEFTIRPRPRNFGYELTKEDFIKLFVSDYGSRRLLEKQCFDGNDCLEIIDEVRDYQGGKKILRAAISNNLCMTSGILKFPKKITESELDTSKWKIDFDIALPGLELVMANDIFAIGSIPKTNTSTARILSIGLGGGSLTGYLHQNFPQMRITAVELRASMVRLATKWFSLETDDHYQVVVDDGIRYLKESIELGREFDAIILDACFLETKSDFLCPDEVFLTEETISNMATVAGERGVLVMNVLPNSGTVKDKTMVKFRKFFKFGRETQVENTYNYVHSYTNFDPSNTS